MRQALLTILRCPVCGGAVEPDEFVGEMEQGTLHCLSCGESFQVDRGMPLMLSDRLPGIAEKKREIGGWVEKAKGEAWYEPEEEVDTNLPFVCRELGWDDPVWASNEYSFSRFLERWVRPGLKILEVGAAKTWASQHLLPRGAEYVATDVLDDDKIGIGRGAFFAERVGHYERVQADGEHLPFARGAFDLTFCVATLHHALDLPKMVAEMSRVTKRGGARGRAERGDAAARLERRGSRPGGREGARDQRAYAHGLGLPGRVQPSPDPREGALPGRTARCSGKEGRWSALATLRAHTFHGKQLGYEGDQPGRRENLRRSNECL